jgi:hypothetical protein
LYPFEIKKEIIGWICFVSVVQTFFSFFFSFPTWELSWDLIHRKRRQWKERVHSISSFNSDPVFKQLRDLLNERILCIDGAMGTQIQSLKLEEKDFRSKQ